MLMATDMLRSMGQQTRIGNNTTSASTSTARKRPTACTVPCPKAASEGSPMAGMPWGAYWGVILDRYGIRWMVNHTPAS
jgi:PhnB protein